MKAIFKGWNLWSVATWGLFTVALVCVESARAQDIGTETVLHSFSGTFNDGSEPTGLVQLSDGSLYGVTVGYVYQNSLVSEDNVFFKITTTGTYTPLANGCGTATGCTTGAQVGRDASSSLINGGDGNLYAIASINSYDQFYQLTPQGAFTALYRFPSYYTNNADFPGGSQLILGSDGNFYGTAYGGPSYGAIYRLTPGGVFTQLYAFTKLSSGNPQVNSDGAYLNAPLAEGTDGNFYGVALYGGVNGSGTIFKITPGGVFSVLYAFSADGDEDLSTSHNADGAAPGAGLVLGQDGNFYGTTQFGGAYGVGTIFKITPAGVFTKLHDFGNTPQASITISATPSTITAGQSAILAWAFAGTNDFYEGGTPVSKLTLGTDGNLYGVAGSPLAGPSGGEAGGGQYGNGIAFQITPDGSFTILYSFGSNAQDGTFPYASLIQGSDGNFYGTTYAGGANPALSGEFGGTVFKLAVGPAPAAAPPCTASGAWSGSESASGSFTAAPTTPGTYTYTLTCTSNTNQVVSQNVTLTVTAAAALPTVTIAANPTSLVLGNSATLTWSSTNATSCTASGAWSGTEAVSGMQGVTPVATGTSSYALTCTGSGGSITSTATVTVTAPPLPTVTIAANPASLVLGGSSILSWSSTNATACAASGAWSGTEAVSGMQGVTPVATGTSSYALSCTGSGGSVTGTATVTVTAPPLPTVTIAANPASLVLGGSSTLNWSSTNATACTAGSAWSGPEATSGTQSVTPTATGTSSYDLTCTGSGGSVTSTATVTVTAPPLPTVTIAANPASLVLGNSSTLSWSSANATSCTASGAWSGTEAVSGTQNVTPVATGTNSYALTCTGSGGSTTSTATVSVTAPAPTVMIAISPTAIATGQSATLSWSSTNATSCTASGAWSGTEATSGSLSESPSAAGTDVYTLSCTGSGGTTIASATLTVSAVAPPPPAAPTVTIAANPPDITLGQSTTLSWSSTNATSCTASGAWNGAEPTGGSMNESPDAAGSDAYTLNCSGAGGSASASASVTVTAATPAAPTLSITAQPAAITLGQSTTLNWSSANAGSCSASGAWSGEEDTAGEQAETPAATGAAIYTLSCSGPGGNVVAAVTVTVSAPVTTTELTGKAGGGGFGFGSLFGLGLFALLRQRYVRRHLGYLMMLFCVPAFAQDLDFDIGKTYLGVRGGVATYIVDRSAVNGSLSADGDAATVNSIDHHKGAGVLYAGVPFYHGLSLELGYADLGIYHVSLSTTSANVGQVAADTVGRLKPAGRGITLGLGGPFDLGRWFAVEPHLGALIYQSKQEVFTPGGTYSKGDYGVGLDAGIALLVHPFRPVYAGAGFECFDTGGGCNVRLASLQLEYHFGR